MELKAVYLEDNTGKEVTLDITEIFLCKDINTGSYPVNQITYDKLVHEMKSTNRLNVWTENFSLGNVDALSGEPDYKHGQRMAIKLIKDEEVVWEQSVG